MGHQGRETGERTGRPAQGACGVRGFRGHCGGRTRVFRVLLRQFGDAHRRGVDRNHVAIHRLVLVAHPCPDFPAVRPVFSMDSGPLDLGQT